MAGDWGWKSSTGTNGCNKDRTKGAMGESLKRPGRFRLFPGKKSLHNFECAIEHERVQKRFDDFCLPVADPPPECSKANWRPRRALTGLRGVKSFLNSEAPWRKAPGDHPSRDHQGGHVRRRSGGVCPAVRKVSL